MKPVFIKFKLENLYPLYQAVFQRNLLVIRYYPHCFGNPDLHYRIFWNQNLVIHKEFNQFHKNLKSAKKELTRYSLMKGAPTFIQNKWIKMQGLHKAIYK